VKDSIGDLISDEDLSKIVERGIEEAFFKEGRNTSSYHAKSSPPLAQQMVEDILAEKVEKAVSAYVKKNAESINELIKTVVENGLGDAFLRSLTSKFQNDLYQLQSNIEQRLMNGNL